MNPIPRFCPKPFMTKRALYHYLATTFLELENPLILQGFSAFRKFHKFISIIFLQGIYLFLHCFHPLDFILMSLNFFETFRLPLIGDEDVLRTRVPGRWLMISNVHYAPYCFSTISAPQPIT